MSEEPGAAMHASIAPRSVALNTVTKRSGSIVEPAGYGNGNGVEVVQGFTLTQRPTHAHPRACSRVEPLRYSRV
eukprot:9621838-Alexandrium_andersonii.AAC.1